MFSASSIKFTTIIFPHYEGSQYFSGDSCNILSRRYLREFFYASTKIELASHMLLLSFLSSHIWLFLKIEKKFYSPYENKAIERKIWVRGFNLDKHESIKWEAVHKKIKSYLVL